MRYNRWGATFGGPVMLPGPSGVWSGKDRLFFFVAYEGLRQTTPATNTFTVPTEAMRNGDFSALLPSTRIYDPATAFVRPDGRVERLPFAGNIIPPDRIDAIGRNYLSYWPLPNLPCSDAQCRNNLIAAVPRTDHFYSVSIRADAALNQKHRLFGRFSHNRRKQHTEGWSGVINGVDPTTSDSFRINDSLAIDHVYTASPGWLLNVRGGLTRFESKSSRAAEGVFDAATLGFPPTTTDLFAETGYLPQFNITNFNPNTGGGTVGGAALGPTGVRRLLVPANRHELSRGAPVPRRLRRPRLSRRRDPGDPRCGLVRVRCPPGRHAAVQRFSRGGDGAGAGGPPARPAVGRTSRAQRDAQQSADLSRVVLSGRLEGLQPVHPQSGAALGHGNSADRAARSQHPWVRFRVRQPD